MLIEILLAVIVGQFVTGLYGLECNDVHMTFRTIGFAVRCARVIDIASDVLGNVAVDHRSFAGPEKILALIARHFLDGSGAADVFDDARAFWNAIFREEAFTGCGFLYTETEVARRIFRTTCHGKRVYRESEKRPDMKLFPAH